MSYWVAGAAIGSAIIGAYSSSQASDAAADSAQDGIDAVNAATGRARSDAINLFSRGLQSSQAGTGGALKFYQENAKSKIAPFVQGNVAAQRVLGQGATQTNNAILGLPVDMAFANYPKTLSADYSGITSAQMPTLGGSYADTVPNVLGGGSAAGETAPETPDKMEGLETAGGNLLSVRDSEFYDPIARIKNPVGLSASTKDKIDSVVPGAKFISNLF